MKKMPRNPFQERNNSMNFKDMDEDLKMSRLLSSAFQSGTKESGPDVNHINFPRYSFPKANTLPPSGRLRRSLLGPG